MSTYGPGSAARYIERKSQATHAALRSEVMPVPPAKESWRKALLDVGDQAEALAESCRRDAREMERQGKYAQADYLHSEADRHEIRAADWRARAEW